MMSKPQKISTSQQIDTTTSKVCSTDSVPKTFENYLKQAYLINNGLYSNNHLSQASAKNKNKSFQLGSLVKLYFSLFYLTVKV